VAIDGRVVLAEYKAPTLANGESHSKEDNEVNQALKVVIEDRIKEEGDGDRESDNGVEGFH
jgi:hypothetical protein